MRGDRESRGRRLAPRVVVGLRIACVALLLSGCAATAPRAVAPVERVGVASFYGDEFAGRRTASGERYNPERLTAAHRSLPFGTRLRVVNLENGRSVVVRVNDRGPVRKDRILDVSSRAARKLGFSRAGLARVKLVPLGSEAGS